MLGLTAVGSPTVTVTADGTVAGVVLLSQSHASVHVDPTSGVLFADVFSCAEFDPAAARSHLAACWDGAVISDRVVDRGPST